MRSPFSAAVPVVLLSGLLVGLFGFMGNSHAPRVYGPSILSWLARQWSAPGTEAMHGWLVPGVSLFFLWRKRHALAAARSDADARALAVVLPCLVLYWAGYRMQQPRLGVLTLVGLAWSIPWYLFGFPVARLILFPCAYLLFAIPLGLLVTPITLPLRLVSSALAAGLLNGFGIAVHRVGTAIRDAAGTAFALEVDEPCSGLHSMVALAAVTAAYGYATQKTALRAWLLFLSSAPLAIVGNATRIVTIAVVARAWGMEPALKLYHHFSAFLVFPVATALMMLLGAALERCAMRKTSAPP